MNEAVSTPKEVIAEMHFGNDEVLKSQQQIQQRKLDLEKAMIIGNIDHGKTRIVFISESGTCEVETTVWAATDETVTLKGGVCIPIHCIQSVNFA